MNCDVLGVLWLQCKHTHPSSPSPPPPLLPLLPRTFGRWADRERHRSVHEGGPTAYFVLLVDVDIGAALSLGLMVGRRERHKRVSCCPPTSHCPHDAHDALPCTLCSFSSLVPCRAAVGVPVRAHERYATSPKGPIPAPRPFQARYLATHTPAGLLHTIIVVFHVAIDGWPAANG